MQSPLSSAVPSKQPAEVSESSDRNIDVPDVLPVSDNVFGVLAIMPNNICMEAKF